MREYSRGSTPSDRGRLRTVWPPAWLAALRSDRPAEPSVPPPEPPAVGPTPSPLATPEPPATSLPPAPAAAARIDPVCRRCGSREYRDVPIHEGQSVRWDCAKCDAFVDFPFWYGRVRFPLDN